MTDHLVIFDMQVKPGSDLRHLKHIGQYIIKHQPEKIICIGDWYDMHSLSSYDRGTKKAEGARYQEDIDAGVNAMEMMLGPMWKLQDRQKRGSKKQYKPQMFFTMGNHEERIKRHINANPLLDGKIGYKDLKLEEMGWKVSSFLEPVIIDGIEYVHYVQNRNSSNAKVSSKAAMEQTNMSVTTGHRPTLDISTSWSDEKGMMWSITCGSSYLDDEDYKGPQGNKHWRGIMHKRNVKDGDYDPTFLRLSTLMEEY